MQRTNHPHPERAPSLDAASGARDEGRVLSLSKDEGRTIDLRRIPDLWLGGAASVIGLGVWAYDKHWQSGVLVGMAALPFLGVLYPLPAWLFGWPQARWIDLASSAFDLLDLVVGLMSIFS